MPCVCAPGRDQVDGQCSALREKEEPRVVRAACNNSALLRALSVTYLLSVTTWAGIPGWRAIRAVATIVARCATPSPPVPVSCQELFLEKRVSIATLFDSMRPATYFSDFSQTRQLFENAQDRQRDGNGFSCLSTAHDRRSYRVAIHAAGFLTIAWKNFDRCRRMRFILFDILWRKLLQMWF